MIALCALSKNGLYGNTLIVAAGLLESPVRRAKTTL
jgi:hypothetical protein